MKRPNFLFLSIMCFAIAIALILVFPVSAAPAMQVDPQPIDVLIQLASAAFFGLVGFPALFSSITTLLMLFGLIVQETADKLHIYLNIAVYGLVFAAVVLGRSDLVMQIDLYLGGLSTVLAAVISVLTGIFGFTVTQFMSTYAMSNTVVQARLFKVGVL